MLVTNVSYLGCGVTFILNKRREEENMWPECGLVAP